MSAPAPNPSRKPPTLVFVEGTERRQFRLQRVPFTIGRRMDKDLVLSESRCSRDHALITLESDGYCLVDEGSKLGTFVNGQRVQRHRLAANDRVEFGVRGGSYLLFEPDSVAHTGGNEAGMFLSRMSGWVPTSSAGEFATLNLLLEAARKLNSSTVLEEVLVTLLEVSLRLTRAERGFVFLRDNDGKFRLAAGRSARGDPLLDDDTISHSSLEEAAASGCEFVVTEAEETDKLLGRRSVEDFGIASVICIPLWNRSVTGDSDTGQVPRKPQAVRGVLYLDSRSLSGRLTAVSHDILRTIATEAATLVENAALVQSREAARRYEQELAIAGSIQQRLLSVRIPEVPYAEVRARSVACQQIGGDFFDVVRTRDALAVVVGDVCGKGVSAALLASVLQGLIYSQLAKSAPLEEVAAVTHGFLCDKEIGEKYATLLLARLRPDGELEMVNCGHLPPLIVSPGKVSETEAANPPVGLVPTVFQGTRLQLRAGDRMVVVTDGVTEAENGAGEYFGGERLRASAPAGLDAVLTAVREFCAGVPLGDDCTALEMMYRG